MAVKDERIRVYALTDTGEDGQVNMQYVLQPSEQSDLGYWAGTAYISGRAKLVGAQFEHVVIYDVPIDDHVPITNKSDAVIAFLPDLTERYQVQSVGRIPKTAEKIVRCLDVSDADINLIDD